MNWLDLVLNIVIYSVIVGVVIFGILLILAFIGAIINENHYRKNRSEADKRYYDLLHNYNDKYR